MHRSYGLKLALKGNVADIMQQSLLYRNAESLYQSDGEQTRLGPRPIISANFGNLRTLRSVEHLLLYHPLFGNILHYNLYFPTSKEIYFKDMNFCIIDFL